MGVSNDGSKAQKLEKQRDLQKWYANCGRKESSSVANVKAPRNVYRGRLLGIMSVDNRAVI